MSPQISPRRKDPTTSQEEADAPPSEAPDSFRSKKAPASFSVSSKDKLTSHDSNKNKTRNRPKNSSDGHRDMQPQLESSDREVDRCNKKERCLLVQPRLIEKDAFFQMLP